MNRLIILILSFTIALTSPSQKCNCPKFYDEGISTNEIGINLYHLPIINLYHLPILQSPYLIDKLDNMNFINGLFYKKHFNKNILRIGLNYYHSKFNIEQSSTYYYYKNVGQSKLGALKLGYERALTKTKLQLYFAADLIFGLGKTKGVSGNRGDIRWWYVETPYDITRTEVAIAPAIGLKYPISRRLALNIESNFTLAYYKSRDFLNPNYSQDNVWKNRINFNPIQMIALSYSF